MNSSGMHISNAVFFCALAFIFGIAAASFGWQAVIAAPVVFMIFVAASAFSGKRILWKHAAIFSLTAFFGMFYYGFYLDVRDARANMPLGEEAVFRGVVANEPRLFEKYQIFDLSLSVPARGRITVFAPPLMEINYGDVLEISGRIDLPEERAARPVAFFPERIVVVGRGEGFWLKEKLLGFKKILLRQFDAHLTPDRSALLGGITLGSRSGFGDELRDKMATSGTTHLVALSGYNITVLVLAVAYVFGSFLPRRKTFYATTAVIVLFVLMVGGEPSVIRAAIMGFIVILAREVGREYDMRNAITLTAGAMLLFDPTSLLDDAGFQLSFASLLGIVYLGPVIKKVFKMEDAGILSWKENIVLTTSAQAMVVPIIAGTFGQFSLTSLAANILILGLIPLTMFLGFALAALSSVYFYLGFFAAKLVDLLLAYELWIMEIFGRMSIPVGAPGSAIMFALFYYFAVAVFIYFYRPTARDN